MNAIFAKPILPRIANPLGADPATIERFIAHCHRRRYPARTDVFRPGDEAGTLYYIISGSVSIIAGEEDGRELVLGYIDPDEFVGELGLFFETGYDRLQLLLTTQANDAARLLYSIGAQISQRLMHTSRKAGRLAFLDVSDRIYRTLFDLAKEPEAMSHPQGTQLRVSRQELARLVGVRGRWPGGC